MWMFFLFQLGQQLVELQIEMNKKMEEYEANTFELTNKVQLNLS